MTAFCHVGARLCSKGARLIGTNTDVTGPIGSTGSSRPAARWWRPLSFRLPGKAAYFVGKPNPLMMRTGLRLLGRTLRRRPSMIGDRMDTDMVAGIETGLGHRAGPLRCDNPGDDGDFPYRPRLVLSGVGEMTGYKKICIFNKKKTCLPAVKMLW